MLVYRSVVENSLGIIYIYTLYIQMIPDVWKPFTLYIGVLIERLFSDTYMIKSKKMVKPTPVILGDDVVTFGW